MSRSNVENEEKETKWSLSLESQIDDFNPDRRVLSRRLDIKADSLWQLNFPPEQCTLSLVDFRFPYFLFRRSILPIALDTIGRKAVSEREREKSSTWLAAFP